MKIDIYIYKLKLRRMNSTERMNPFPTRDTRNVGNAFMRSSMLRDLSIKIYFKRCELLNFQDAQLFLMCEV